MTLLIYITFVSLCASSYFPRISRLKGFLGSDYKLQAKQKITHGSEETGFPQNCGYLLAHHSKKHLRNDSYVTLAINT